MTHFTDDNFQQEVVEASKTKPVLVDFYADWCGPCQIQAPIVEELAKDFADKAIVGKVDTEASPKIAQSYHIMSIPTLMIFKGGEMVKSYIGVQLKDDLEADLKQYA